jgi:drug/metabolite transporter (DMT)-like permease
VEFSLPAKNDIRGMAWRPNALFVLNVIVFVLTGWMSSVNVQLAKYHNIDSAGVIMFAYGVGNALTILVDPAPFCLSKQSCAPLLAAGFADAVANIFFSVSLLLAGSMYHTIIYSSLPVVVAVVRKVVLGNDLTLLKWVALVGMVVGLVLTVKDAQTDFHSKAEPDAADAKLLVGVVASFMCVVVMSGNYVVSEWALTHQYAPSEPQLTWACGCFGMIIGAIFMSIERDDITSQWSMLSSADVTNVAFLVISLAIGTGVHMLTFFWICRHSSDGSVFLGVLQGVRAVVVLVYGAFALCEYQKSQCMTPSKSVSVSVVMLTVAVFLVADTLPPFFRPKASTPLLAEGVGPKYTSH